MTSILHTARAIVEAGKAATPGPWVAAQARVYGHVKTESGNFVFERGFGTRVNTDCHFIALARSADRVAEALLRAMETIKEMDSALDFWEASEGDSTVKIWEEVQRRGEAARKKMKDFLAELEREMK